MHKKIGAPLKRGVRLLPSGITAELDAKYRNLAEEHGLTKTALKRLVLEYVMSLWASGTLNVTDVLPRKEASPPLA